jgi:RHS repeat-associated protein
MKASCRYFFLIAAMMTGAVSAQVSTGLTPFGSFGGGPFDTVNTGNLNVHFAIPVLHKAGRGVPFSYDLSYDSSVWAPVTASGVTQWQPDSNWGWRAATEAATGWVGWTLTVTFCPDPPRRGGTTDTYSNWVYHDRFGVAHHFPGEAVITTGTCGNSTSGENALAMDGSGYGLSTTNGVQNITVTARNGETFHPPGLAGTGAGTFADANGNQITVNNSGQFFDTLSSTTPVLTVTGTGTPSSPSQFTYSSPSGTNVSDTVNYVQYTVQTGFGISGVNEYGPLSNSLVSGISLPDGSSYSFTYEKTPGSCTPLSGTYSANCVTGRIASVTLPTGGKITYTYSGGSNGIESDGSTAGLSRALSPGGTWAYSRTLVSGTPGPGSTWQTTITDPVGNQTVVNLAEDGATNSSSTVATYNFFETQRQNYQGSATGTLLSTTMTCYNGNITLCGTSGVASPVTRTSVFRFFPNTSGLEAETDTTIDQNGLTSEVDEYDYAAGGVGPLIRKTFTSYNASLTNGIVDRPSSVFIRDANNNLIAFTSYGFDETVPTQTSGTPQHVAITGSRGLLTSVMASANGSTTLYRKYTYYDTGNLATSTDVSTSNTTNGAITTYNYASGTASCGNSFVTSITEPLNLSRSMTWDCNGGVMLSLTDENNNTSSTAYSGSNYTNVYWRPYSTTDQAGTTTNYFYILNSSNQPFQAESKSATFNSGNSIVDVLTTTDAFGRAIFHQTKQGPSATNYDTVATCYDSSGRVSLTTLPYSSAVITPSTSTCPSTNPGTSYAYDALSRTTSVSDSGGGSTAYTYTQNDVLQTLTSPTQKKQQEYDALGRLKSVCEITAGTTTFPGGNCAQTSAQTGYLATYTYDVLSNLSGVTQNAQASSGKRQTRAYVYDMLGRLTSETNPEMNNTAVSYSYDSLSSDASCGTITSAGNILKRVDAAGNATCYSGYDALHRVGTTTYPSTSTPAKHFVYDTATVNGTSVANAKTRLAEAYTCTGTCTSKITDLGFGYSVTGQPTDVYELTPHSGGYYHVNASPWPNGVVNLLQGLSGLPTITYSTDGKGRQGTVSASSGQNPVTSITYDPASHVTALTYGSSDSDSFQFDSNTGRMKQYQFSVGSSPKTDTGVLTWNPNWTLETLAITDQLNSTNTQTCTYTHDALGRIASANCGSSIWSQTFSYDPFGNITKTVPGGATGTSFQPSYDYTNNTNRITSTPFTYNNNNGNMTADNQHAYAWDTENKLVSIDAGISSAICQTYDALERVVEQDKGSACTTSPTSSIEIVYSPAGAKLALMNGSSPVKAFVPLPGGAQAVYNSSGLQYYRHPDWLGSSRLATTTSRTVFFDGAYAPYGENYAGSGTQDLAFTGQNQDTESSGSGGAGGLYDFLFREHSPVQGRWLSPDPAGLAAANPTDPQSWNRYTYVGNRPLSSTDPLGLLCRSGAGTCGGRGQGGPCDPNDPFGDPCGSPCDPSDPSCGLPCDPNEIIPCGGGIGGGGGGGGGNGDGGGGSGPCPGCNSPQPTGGVGPNNETPGLPQGLNLSPLQGLDGVLSLLPGLNCGGTSSGFLGGDSSSGLPTDVCSFIASTPPPDQPNWQEAVAVGAVVAAAAATTGLRTVDLLCTQAPNSSAPQGGGCRMVCTSRAGQDITLGGIANISMSDIQAKCGPRVSCPIEVGIQTKVLCIFGWCVGIGRYDLKWCF